ncbi:autophagy protein 13 [Pichia californica]|nr:autophagy protein 13 [[Candida] californica]
MTSVQPRDILCGGAVAISINHKPQPQLSWRSTMRANNALAFITCNVWIRNSDFTVVVGAQTKRQHNSEITTDDSGNAQSWNDSDIHDNTSKKYLTDLDGNVSSFRGYNQPSIISQTSTSENKAYTGTTNTAKNITKEKQQQQQTQKQDIWFNLKTFNTHISKNDILPWYNKDVTSLPPMIVETVLDLSELNEKNKKLFIDDELITTKKKSELVLERWLIKLELENYDNDSIQLPVIYKKSIVMFRCLYTLARLLPASKLLDKNISKYIKIKTKILNGSKSLASKGRFGLSRALIPDKPDMDIVESKDLLPVLTPIGSLYLSVSYRRNCNFQVQDNDLDEEIYSRTITSANTATTTHINTETNTNKLPGGKEIPISSSANSNTDYPATSPIGNIKFRTSSTSINSLSSRRRMSVRSVSIFKTGSMASSSPPNTNYFQNVNNSISPNQGMTSSFANSNPIPVNKADSTSSVHFYNNSSDRNDNNVNSSNALITSTPGKFPSSFGSKFRSGSSRNNSLEGQLVNNNNFTPSSNPILQNFKSRNRFITSSFSDMEPNNSLYLDDDLNNFLKLLDSKPDLRISNNSSIIYQDSLSNFKTLRKNNELFSDSQLKESLAFSRSASSSPSKPPPLISYHDKKSIDPTVKLLLDNKQNFELDSSDNNHYFTSAPINFSTSNHINASQNNIGNTHIPFGSLDRNLSYERSFNRARTNSRDSRESKDSHGSRGSRGSIGIIHGPLITSTSYSPNSNGNSGPTSHSIHSILKASATSGTSGAIATGINTVIENDDDYSKDRLTDSSHDHQKLDRISPSPTSSLPRNIMMNRVGSTGGRAHSLLRSLSVSSGGYAYQLPKSRTGSSGSISGSHLRNVLSNNLKNVSSKNSNKHGTITPEQLKDISYGQDVFDSEDDVEENKEDVEKLEGVKNESLTDDKTENISQSMNSNDDSKDGKKNISTTTVSATMHRGGNRGSLTNILRNIQRRQSSTGSGKTYDHLRINGKSGPVTLHSNDLGYERCYDNNKRNHIDDDDDDDDNDDDEEEDEEEDDLLFEMSDMNAIK